MNNDMNTLTTKRRKWVEANRENDFERGLKKLLTDLYPDEAHFVYELLQNAEDALANEVRFSLYNDRVEFEHDGERLFSMRDVNAITSIGFSTKRTDATTIGKFGIGFKAVFAYTDVPEVHSGDFHFRIHDMVIPEPVKEIQTVTDTKRTRFILPFNNPRKKPEQAVTEVEKLLMSLDSTAVLFLAHIHKIAFRLPDSSEGYIERKVLDDNIFEIEVCHPGKKKPSLSHFLKFEKEVTVLDEESGEGKEKNVG